MQKNGGGINRERRHIKTGRIERRLGGDHGTKGKEDEARLSRGFKTYSLGGR